MATISNPTSLPLPTAPVRTTVPPRLRATVAVPRASIRPTFVGWIETPEDASLLVRAALADAGHRMREHPCPLVPIMVNDVQCHAFVWSGAVAVFLMVMGRPRRWVDATLWTPGRPDGNFFVSMCPPLCAILG